MACEDSQQGAGFPVKSHRNAGADKWGDITVAQPKIWQFERVSALLDGLLRDVEGISLGDLTQLDPSQQNAAALKFIQSALEVGVQYDQAGALNAANTLSSYNAVHASQTQQLDQYNNYMQTLTSERDRLAAQYAGASNEVNGLQALKAAGPLTDAQNKQLEEATSRQSSTQASLTSVNSLISGAGAAPALTAPPTVTGTSVQGPASGSTMSSSLMGFSDVLKSLPSGVQSNLSAALNSPSYPATKRLDNFITLLYERLAREISVLQDDLTRDPDNVAFLLQFDVGLYPSKKAKDHVARVEFNLDCPGCKVYSLYPGQSSYNLANYSGASKRNTFWGNALTLIGLGVSASYRRQTDTLQGSLVQSVYTAGFQNGVLDDRDPRSHVAVDANRAEQSFGWYYGSAPFEQLVTPGIRSTFALITVPRKLIYKTADKFGNVDACVPFHIDAGWANRTDPVAQDGHFWAAGTGAKYLAWPAYHKTREKLIEPDGRPESDSSEKATTHEKTPAETGTPPYDASVLTMMTSVKLPASIDDYSLVANREKKMHVLRMEYNTVYAKADPAAAATVIQTTVQMSSQSTNQATGQTVGQTTSQTTGTAVAVGNASTGNKTASASAALNPLPCAEGKCAPVLLKLDRPIDPNLVVTVRGAPLMRVRDWRGRATSVLPAAQSGSDLAGSASAAGSLTLKQLQQTRSLLEADQFAPNTWYALNSRELLLNISIDVATDEEFPVIQLADPSGSVIIPYDLRRSFTELIVDGFRMRPQTEYSIQSEVGRQNWREDTDEDTGVPSCPNGANPPRCIFTSFTGDAPISSGPYAFSTFLPMFSPDTAPRRFFAVVGETGDDLLIGFLPYSAAKKTTEKTPRYDWLGTQTRVILEDRQQDFAWSLSCDGQGDLLACRMPREEISRAYVNFLKACPNEDVCPGLELEWQSLLQSLSRTHPQFIDWLKQKQQQQRQTRQQSQIRGSTSDEAISDRPEPTRRSVLLSETGFARAITIAFNPASANEMNRFRTGDDAEGDGGELAADEKEISTNLSLDANDLRDFRNAFVSTMQLWIQQSDPEGKNVFYSPDPVRIGFLPLSNDYWNRSAFKPWKYEEADADSITLQECNYLPEGDQANVQVSVLGVPAWSNSLVQSPKAPANPDSMVQADDRSGWAFLNTHLSPPHCGKLRVPTAALANDPLMFSMEFPTPAGPGERPKTDLTSPNRPIRTTIAIPRFRIGPTFKQTEIRRLPDIELPGTEGRASAQSAAWRILIPVEHSICMDDVELPVKSQIAKEWWTGFAPLKHCSREYDSSTNSGYLKAWRTADQAGRINLYLEIPRAAIKDLPNRINVVRTTSDGATWVVATLPDLRRLLLPSGLTLESLGATQFALRGENAGVIDAVAMRSGSDNSAATFRTAQGVDFALVTLPAASAGKDSSDTSGGGAGSSSSTQISIVTTKDNADTVKMTQSNSSTPAKAASPDAKTPSSDDKTAAPKALAAGTYAVVPLMLVGTTPPDQAKISEKTKTAAAADAAAQAAKKAEAAAKGKAAKSPEAKAATDAEAKSAAAKKAAADAANAAEPTPIYMPLNVTDEKGKALVFTIPDTKKLSTTSAGTTPATSTTTCMVPCATLPCTASCPQTSAPATAPKTP